MESSLYYIYTDCKSNYIFCVCQSFFFKDSVMDKNFDLIALQNSYDFYKNCKCITFVQYVSFTKCFSVRCNISLGDRLVNAVIPVLHVRK